MTVVAVTIATCCVVWAIVAGLAAVRFCQRRAIPVNVVFLGIEMVRCLSRYRELTCAETGRIGPLFYHYVIPINAALIITVALIVSRFV